MLLSKKIPQRKAKQNLTKLKSFDPATLPPYLCVLEQKIASQLCHPCLDKCSQGLYHEWDPLKHGWLEDKTGNLAPNWFDRQWVPINLFHEESEMEDEMSDDDNGAENSDNDSNSESDVDSGDENSDSDNDSSV